MRGARQIASFPTINLGGTIAGLGTSTNGAVAGYAKLENHTLSADAVRLSGRHTVKFGGTYRVNRDSFLQSNAGAGSFTFSEGFPHQSFNSNLGVMQWRRSCLGCPSPPGRRQRAGSATNQL